MRLFFLNIILAFLWAALTADFHAENIAIGFVISFLIIAITGKIWKNNNYAKKVWFLTNFLLFIIWEMLISNYRVASDVLRFRLKTKPGVIAIPLEAKSDIEITIIANLISLTPGTLTLDISSDRKILFVHTMFADDVAGQRKMIKRDIEEKILRILE